MAGRVRTRSTDSIVARSLMSAVWIGAPPAAGEPQPHGPPRRRPARGAAREVQRDRADAEDHRRVAADHAHQRRDDDPFVAEHEADDEHDRREGEHLEEQLGVEDDQHARGAQPRLREHEEASRLGAGARGGDRGGEVAAEAGARGGAEGDLDAGRLGAPADLE